MKKIFKDNGLGMLIFILILGSGYWEKPMAASSVRSDGVSIDQTNICDPTTPNACAPVDPVLGMKVQAVVSGATNQTVIQPTGSLLHVTVDSGGGGAVTDGTNFSANSSSFAPTGGVYNDSLTTGTSGSSYEARITPYRAYHFNLRNNSGIEIATSANPLYNLIQCAVTTNAPSYSNGTNQLCSLDTSGQLRVNPGLFSAFSGTSTTFAGTWPGDSVTNYLSFTTVSGYQNGSGGAAYVASTTGSITVNGSGSFAVTGVGSSTNGATVTDGTTAIFLGGCTGLSTQPTAVSTGTASRCVNTLDGSRYVRYGGPITWFAGTSADAATTVKIKSAPGAGLSLYISDVITQSNTATAGLFTLVSGTGAGNNCTTGQAAIFNNSTSALYASPANTAPVNHFHLSIPIQLPANVDLCVLGVATNTTNITVTGFTAP